MSIGFAANSTNESKLKKYFLTVTLKYQPHEKNNHTLCSNVYNHVHNDISNEY